MNTRRWVRNQWDRTAALVATGTGLLGLLLGWVGVSGATLPSQQIPYLASGGLVGLFALGIAATLWLSADLHDEWRKLDELRDQLEDLNRHLRQTEAADHTPPVNGSPPARRRRPVSAKSS